MANVGTMTICTACVRCVRIRDSVGLRVIVTPLNSTPRCTIILYYTHFIRLYYIIDNIYGGTKGGQYNPVEKAAGSLSTERPAPFRLGGMTRLVVDFSGLFSFFVRFYNSLEANFTFCVDRIVRFRLLWRYRVGVCAIRGLGPVASLCDYCCGKMSGLFYCDINSTKKCLYHLI